MKNVLNYPMFPCPLYLIVKITEHTHILVGSITNKKRLEIPDGPFSPFLPGGPFGPACPISPLSPSLPGSPGLHSMVEDRGRRST